MYRGVQCSPLHHPTHTNTLCVISGQLVLIGILMAPIIMVIIHMIYSSADRKLVRRAFDKVPPSPNTTCVPIVAVGPAAAASWLSCDLVHTCIGGETFNYKLTGPSNDCWLFFVRLFNALWIIYQVYFKEHKLSLTFRVTVVNGELLVNLQRTKVV